MFGMHEALSLPPYTSSGHSAEVQGQTYLYMTDYIQVPPCNGLYSTV
jgi:hypothetical protein